MAQSSQEQPARPRIEFVTDYDHPGGTMLIMDAVRQSYVDIDDPTYLDFEYMQYFASVLAVLPAGPLTTTHIGGGGLTLPRYLSVERPGSTQLVLEPDAELMQLVREKLPLPREHRIRVRTVDGLAGVAQLGEASADLVVLDAYADGRVPAELTTVEFFADVSRVLRASGMLLANVVDEPGLRYVGRVVAGLREVFGHVLLVASHDVLKGRRFGNVVLAASAVGFDLEELHRDLRRQPFPAAVRDSDELAARFAGARSLKESDSQRSPEPIRAGWRVR
jgi:spermidine synthase